jgi:Na+-translocating ferredoxin:NAD+ oxidoreductase RnfG subunit
LYIRSFATKGFRVSRRKKIILAIVAAVAAAIVAVFISGCSQKSKEPYRDAQTSNAVNGAPVDLIRNADGFSNLSTKCDHGNRIYVVYHGNSAYGAVAVVPQDPTCRAGNN